jgi:RNA polymerase sigma-54 factor
MRMGQQMKLAPRMIQSMEILQMPLQELQERIEQELENNPTLELTEIEPDADARVAPPVDDAADERAIRVDAKSGQDDFERLNSFESENPDAAENEYSASDSAGSDYSNDRLRREDLEYRPSRTNSSGDEEFDPVSVAPARSASLTDQLLEQWDLCDVQETLRPLGRLIIQHLDADGYLRTPLETIADRAPEGAKPPLAELERALAGVQLFLEPAGIASRDARECLLLQLDGLVEREDGPEVDYDTMARTRRIIEEHLDDLMKNRLPRVAEKTGYTLEQIKSALEVMRRLSLAPARQLVEESAPAIIPDAIVEYDADNDRYIAYLNESRIPALRINQEYALLSKDRGVEKRDRDFLKTNLGNAAWLIDAVNQRKQTLLRVVRAVVSAQRDFFDLGSHALRPLPMTQIADELGIHVATVSRAVADKHISTPRGIVALRKFFSGGVSVEGGEQVAWDAIKVALSDVVESEDKAKPFSDEDLAEELKKRGIEIARRTVAKYRDQLNIPSARMRKTF